MSFKFSLFKTPKHQRFEYGPRYYDPEKEELKARLKAAGHLKEGESAEGEYRKLKLAKEFSSIRRKSFAFARREKSKSRLRFIYHTRFVILSLLLVPYELLELLHCCIVRLLS